jgi:hypothetical protein
MRSNAVRYRTDMISTSRCHAVLGYARQIGERPAVKAAYDAAVQLSRSGTPSYVAEHEASYGLGHAAREKDDWQRVSAFQALTLPPTAAPSVRPA